MPDDIGWWIFDAETQTLINRWSAQRVRCEGAVDGTGPVRLRFSYQETAIPHLAGAGLEGRAGHLALRAR